LYGGTPLKITPGAAVMNNGKRCPNISGGNAKVLDATGKNYLVPFLMAGFAYLAALLVIHLLLPKLQPMQID